jgi:hypothetical protein
MRLKILSHKKPSIALCTLGSMNWGVFKHPDDMRRACRILLRALHNLLQYQDFLSVQSKLSNDEIEPIGIGITNLAYWHAKRKLKYGEDEALAEVKRWMEHQAFYLTEASNELAKEKGACKHSDRICYGNGVFPWERRSKGVNELTDFTPSSELDWEGLRANLLKYGIRNATLMAIAPVESCVKSETGVNTIDFGKIEYRAVFEKAGLDWKRIEETNAVGFYDLAEPIGIVGPNGDREEIIKLYYNGVAEVDELTFEDGSTASFTPNHRLLVNRNGDKIWLHVRDIEEGDDIVETGNFGQTQIPT